jgi:hypothetical protein
VPIARPQIVSQSVPITYHQQTISDGHSCEHCTSDEKGEQDEEGSAVSSSIISSKRCFNFFVPGGLLSKTQVLAMTGSLKILSRKHIRILSNKCKLNLILRNNEPISEICELELMFAGWHFAVNSMNL